MPRVDINGLETERVTKHFDRKNDVATGTVARITKACQNIMLFLTVRHLVIRQWFKTLVFKYLGQRLKLLLSMLNLFN